MYLVPLKHLFSPPWCASDDGVKLLDKLRWDLRVASGPSAGKNCRWLGLTGAGIGRGNKNGETMVGNRKLTMLYMSNRVKHHICAVYNIFMYNIYNMYMYIYICTYTYDQTIGKVDPNWEVDPFKFVTISIPRVSMDYHPPPYFNAILLCLFKPLFLAASYRMGPPFSIAWTVAVDVCGWIWLGLW